MKYFDSDQLTVLLLLAAVILMFIAYRELLSF